MRRVARAARGVKGPGGHPGTVAVEEQLLDEWIKGDHVQVAIAGTNGEGLHLVRVSVSNATHVRQGERAVVKVAAAPDARDCGCPVEVAVADKVRSAVVGEERWRVGSRHRVDYVGIAVPGDS